MKSGIYTTFFSLLFMAFLSFTLISCEEDQTTEATAGVPSLVVPGQTLRAMIVHISSGGTQYYVTTETLLARGGAPLSGYTWSVANLSALPAGTSIESLTGIFKSSGGSLVAGTHNFILTASDGSRSANGNFKLIVEEYDDFGPLVVFQQPMGVFNINLPDANSGYGYGATLWVKGDGALPWSWYLESGDLPQGMVIDESKGILRGTPHSSAAGNDYSFTVMVKDNNGETAVSDVLNYHIKVPR